MTSPAELFMPTHSAPSKLCVRRASAVKTKSIAAPEPMQALQDRIATFQRTRFPEQSLDGKLAHMVREICELRADPDDNMEWADVLILLLGAAAWHGLTIDDLLQAAQTKMGINENRQWGPADPEGIHHHIEKLP
jgi:hypothetical protein